MIPTALRYALLLLSLVALCLAKDATVAGRVRVDYEDTLWQPRPATVPGADVLQLANDDGAFTVLVMPEELVAGGMSSAESRRKYFEQLAKKNVRTEDVVSTEVDGKSGFEFRGKRSVGGVEYRMRIVLIVDAGDVVILMSSAQDRDPMDVASIAALWKSLSISPNIPRPGLIGAANGSTQIDPAFVEVERMAPEDAAIREEWVRATKDEDILGVSAVKLSRLQWSWQISVNVAEFVRHEPLESKLKRVITDSLRTVKGVKRVAQEDREVWIVDGESARGDDLVRACAVGLSTIEAELRKAYDSPPSRRTGGQNP